MAFAYRAATAAAAERTLDVQYYIWHDDLTGRLLAAELMRAAERGVRVRLLIDDLDARDKHDLLRGRRPAPQHRGARSSTRSTAAPACSASSSEFVLRGSRLNHRMHNKAWIADNRDRDRRRPQHRRRVLRRLAALELQRPRRAPGRPDRGRREPRRSTSTGTARTPCRSSRFDCASAEPGELDELIAAAREYREDADDTPYIAALRDVQKRAELLLRRPPPLLVRDCACWWTTRRKVGTEKQGLRRPRCCAASSTRSAAATRGAADHFAVLRAGQARARPGLVDDVERGLRVAVLTNSLAATDVAAVHTGYARYRRELLRGGVELYEMKRNAAATPAAADQRLGSSGASLHTKAMLIDRRWVYVGSMNLDPRSANLNTEMGVLVESPELAEQLRAQFDLHDLAGAQLPRRARGGRGTRLVRSRRGEERRLGARAGRQHPATAQRHAAAALARSSRSCDAQRRATMHQPESVMKHRPSDPSSRPPPPAQAAAPQLQVVLLGQPRSARWC